MKMSVIASAVFAVICYGVAITGFSGLGDITDPAQRSDGEGFALFWTFLGIVATAFGALGLWLLKTYKEEA
jgi:ABC-type multidrug transport system permease subunit